MFYELDRVKYLRSDLVQWIQNNLILPTLTPQTARVSWLHKQWNISENNKYLSNHILLIFKLYVYKPREKNLLNINNLIAEI